MTQSVKDLFLFVAIRARSQLLFVLLIASASISPASVTANDAIQELLEADAPPPDWREFLRQNPANIPVPTLAASDDDLLEYWRWRESDDKPDAPTQLRLLEICEHSPREFGGLARFFSSDSEALNERLKRLHDRLRAGHTEEQNDLADGVQEWLMLNSDAFAKNWLLQRKENATARKQHKRKPLIASCT